MRNRRPSRKESNQQAIVGVHFWSSSATHKIPDIRQSAQKTELSLLEERSELNARQPVCNRECESTSECTERSGSCRRVHLKCKLGRSRWCLAEIWS
jgi:hypothetical protein